MSLRKILFLFALAAFAACGPVSANQGVPCGSNVTCYFGSCDESSGTPVCVCDNGYTGAECSTCADGWAPNGNGTCREMSLCEQTCAAQHRECDPGQVDIVCGDCLEGYYEDQGVCFQSCAEETNQGQIVPLDIYIMLDRSSSMADTGKWNAVISAIQGFVDSPEAAGIGVGLQFFPVDPSGPIPTDCADCGLYGPCVPIMNVCSGSLSPDTSCDPADYGDAAVGIATLPGIRQTIVDALNAASPDRAATPTQPAMAGAVDYATAWAQSHPDHLTFIVFATDGEPTGCSINSIQGTADMATAAANNNPSVKTYVIGVGSTLDSLNQIAAAGGTGQAYIVDAGGNVTQDFLDALNEVRANGLCKYQIPQPQQGNPDYDRINVRLVDPLDPSSAMTIPNVGTEAGCGSVDGWYYDDPGNPNQIRLCPASCDAVTQNNLDVEVLVGCETIVL